MIPATRALIPPLTGIIARRLATPAVATLFLMSRRHIRFQSSTANGVWRSAVGRYTPRPQTPLHVQHTRLYSTTWPTNKYTDSAAQAHRMEMISARRSRGNTHAMYRGPQAMRLPPPRSAIADLIATISASLVIALGPLVLWMMFDPVAREWQGDGLATTEEDKLVHTPSMPGKVENDATLKPGKGFNLGSGWFWARNATGMSDRAWGQGWWYGPHGRSN